MKMEMEIGGDGDGDGDGYGYGNGDGNGDGEGGGMFWASKQQTDGEFSVLARVLGNAITPQIKQTKH